VAPLTKTPWISHRTFPSYLQSYDPPPLDRLLEFPSRQLIQSSKDGCSVDGALGVGNTQVRRRHPPTFRSYAKLRSSANLHFILYLLELSRENTSYSHVVRRAPPCHPYCATPTSLFSVVSILLSGWGSRGGCLILSWSYFLMELRDPTSHLVLITAPAHV